MRTLSLSLSQVVNDEALDATSGLLPNLAMKNDSSYIFSNCFSQEVRVDIFDLLETLLVGLRFEVAYLPNLSPQSSSAKSTISFACNNDRGDRAYFGKTTALLLSRLDRTRAIFQPHPIEITSAIILLKQFQDQIQDRL